MAIPLEKQVITAWDLQELEVSKIRTKTSTVCSLMVVSESQRGKKKHSQLEIAKGMIVQIYHDTKARHGVKNIKYILCK